MDRSSNSQFEQVGSFSPHRKSPTLKPEKAGIRTSSQICRTRQDQTTNKETTGEEARGNGQIYEPTCD